MGQYLGKQHCLLLGLYGNVCVYHLWDVSIHPLGEINLFHAFACGNKNNFFNAYLLGGFCEGAVEEDNVTRNVIFLWFDKKQKSHLLWNLDQLGDSNRNKSYFLVTKSWLEKDLFTHMATKHFDTNPCHIWENRSSFKCLLNITIFFLLTPSGHYVFDHSQLVWLLYQDLH